MAVDHKELELKLESFASEENFSPQALNEISQLTAAVECPEPLLAESVQPVSANLPADSISAEREESSDIRMFISKATLPQKIKLALFGNATCRMLLIRDANRMVQQFVMKNPRLQPTEVEDFARNSNSSELVLRTIAGNSQWMKSYALKAALVSNPKTPPDIGIKWVKFLNVTELRKLSKSKNISHVVAISARKRLEESSK